MRDWNYDKSAEAARAMLARNCIGMGFNEDEKRAIAGMMAEFANQQRRRFATGRHIKLAVAKAISGRTSAFGGEPVSMGDERYECADWGDMGSAAKAVFLAAADDVLSLFPEEPPIGNEGEQMRERIAAHFDKAAEQVSGLCDASPFHSVSHNALTTYATNLSGWAREIRDLSVLHLSDGAKLNAVLRVIDSCGGAKASDESDDHHAGYNAALDACEREMKRAWPQIGEQPS